MCDLCKYNSIAAEACTGLILFIYRYSQTAALPYRDQCLKFVHVEVLQRLQFIVAVRRLSLGSDFAILRRTTHRVTSYIRTMIMLFCTNQNYYAAFFACGYNENELLILQHDVHEHTIIYALFYNYKRG